MAWVRPCRPARKRRSFPSILQAACAGMCLLAPPARADSGFWISPIGGNWSNPANWSSTPAIPNGVDETATFGNVSAAGQSIGVDVPMTIGGLLFDSPSNYTLGAGDSGALTFSTSTGNAFITVNNTYGNGAHTLAAPLRVNSAIDITNASTGPLLLSGSISGSGALTKLGAGPLNLSGDNSAWTGPLTIAAGTLSPVGSQKALGSGDIIIKDGAAIALDRIEYSGNTIANDITLTGNGPDGQGAIRYNRFSPPVFLTGNITLAGGGGIGSMGVAWTGQAVHIGDPVTQVGALTGTGGLSIVGTGWAGGGNPGYVQLNVKSTHTGGTTIESGTLVVSPSGSLVGTGDITIWGNGVLHLYQPAGNDPAINSVSPGSIILNPWGTASLYADISPMGMFNAASGSGGKLWMQVNNTHDINLSTLMGGSDDGDKVLIAMGNATTYSGSFSFNPQAKNRTVNFEVYQWPEVSSDLLASNGVQNVAVIKGGGNLILSGNNTYAGTTTISGCSLTATRDTSLGAGTGSDADATIVEAGGTLYIASKVALANEKIILNGGRIVSSGTTQGPVELQADNTIRGGIFNGAIGGTGSVTFDAGITTLAGANTYTGKTVISGATVNVNHSSALGAATEGTTVTGGTLNVNVPIAEPLTVSGGTVRLNASNTNRGTGLGGLAITTEKSGRIIFNASQHLTRLGLAGGSATVASGHDKLIHVEELSIGPAGKLDVTDNGLIVQAVSDTQGTTLSEVIRLAQSGRLVSSAAAANRQTGLAILANDKGNGVPLLATFDGQAVDAHAILVQYTWNGDANLDGAIDAGDYFLIDSGFITQKGGYRNGDFNYDGVVDAADYFLIDSAFIAQTGVPGFIAVPEPAALSLLMAACLAGLRRRRLT